MDSTEKPVASEEAARIEPVKASKAKSDEIITGSDDGEGEDEDAQNLANDLEKEIARHEKMAEVKHAGMDSDASSEED